MLYHLGDKVRTYIYVFQLEFVTNCQLVICSCEPCTISAFNSLLIVDNRTRKVSGDPRIKNLGPQTKNVWGSPYKFFYVLVCGIDHFQKSLTAMVVGPRGGWLWRATLFLSDSMRADRPCSRQYLGDVNILLMSTSCSCQYFTDINTIITSLCGREVGGWGRVPFSKKLMSPTPRRKWYLTKGRRAH